MNGEVISFFEKFTCLADKCPDNCCRAWDMPVDSETLEHYEAVSGKDGLLLRLKLTRNREGDVVLRTLWGKCCNLNKDGLCKLQCNGQSEFMPKVCKLYPRNTVAYGDYHLGMLDLSCIAAAKMFVETEGRLEFVPAPEDMPIYWTIDDVYEDFVCDLREDLNNVLDYLWNAETSLWIIERDIFAHCFAMHCHLVRDDAEGARYLPFDIDSIKDMCEEQWPRILEMRISEDTSDYPFFPMSFINELIYQNIPEDYLMMYHPKVYKLLKSYKRQFGKITESSADRAFMGNWKDICEKHSWLSDKIKSYFSYKLQMNYLNASIDYYVLEPVLLAMLNVQFLMVLVITADGKGDELSPKKFAELIAENERLLSHNKVFNSEAMQRIRSELF
ncbi:MAG: flagellin lysine-N-methylase [Lachnospiraceae bacterium]|nr:flagellin lysine-N-methylase [Lachnospiraceae bacterium]